MPIGSPGVCPVARAEVELDCQLCPRLAQHRRELRQLEPDRWNAPVPAFGDGKAWLAIVGLAPGRRGANRTGRAFTGDASGELLFRTMASVGLVTGEYQGTRADGLRLNGVMILNAVSCLPPANRPLPSEANNCRPFMMAALGALPNLRTIVALGRFAHDSLCRGLGLSPGECRFAHGAEHAISKDLLLIDSYHCSPQNVNTGRLTADMFRAVFERALAT